MMATYGARAWLTNRDALTSPTAGDSKPCEESLVRNQPVRIPRTLEIVSEGVQGVALRSHTNQLDSIPLRTDDWFPKIPALSGALRINGFPPVCVEGKRSGAGGCSPQ